jgi:PAS domain S-box-containing protein
MQSLYAVDLPTLEQVIESCPLTVLPDTLLLDAIALMNPASSSTVASCVLVVNETSLVGILTLRDVVRLTGTGVDLSQVKISEVMTQPVISLTQAAAQNALTALAFMRQHSIRHLPVVDEQGQLLGLITQDKIRQVIQPAHLLKLRCVTEVMVTEVVHALPTTSVLELSQIMSDRQISCVVIVAPQETAFIPVGMITEKDILQVQLQGLDINQTQAQAVMSSSVLSITPTDSLWTVHQLMQARGVRRLVIVGEQGQLQGLVTQTNLLQVLDPLEIVNVIQALQAKVEEQTVQLQQSNQQLEQEVTQRRQVEASLRQAQQELELRVVERTAELLQANARLKQEIEERKKLQTALQLNQYCLDRAIDVAAYIDPNGRFIYVNEQICRLLKYSRAELLSMSVYDIHLDICTPALWADFWQRIKQQGNVVFESLLRSRDGEVVTLEINANYLKLQGQEFAWGFARDIRERKQAEITLQKMATDLEILYGHIPCGYHSLDGEGRFIDINDTELAMLGYSREEIMGRKFTDFLTPESISTFEENFPRFKQTGRLHDVEFQLIRKDDSILPVSISATAIKDEAGNYLMSRSIVLDISERQAALRDRQQAEVNLQKSEQRLKLALWAGNTGTWDWDLQTNEVIWSDHLFSLFGLTPDTFDVSYENFLNQIVHPEDRERLHQSVLRAIDQQVPHNLEFRFFYPDRTVGWSLCKGQVLYNKTTGEPLQMIGVNMDITERKEAEIALRESEQKLQAIIDNSPSAIYVKDTQGRHILVNSEFERVTQVTREQAKNQTDYDLFSPNIAQALTRNDQTVLTSGKPLQSEETVELDDGLHTFLSVKFPLCDSFGQTYAICGISTDITERKQSQEALRLSEQKLQAIINNSAVAIYMIDPQHRYLLVNRWCAKLVSTTPENMLGKSIYEFWPADLADKFVAYNQHVLKTKQVIQVEEVVPQADGLHTYITVKFPLCDGTGKPYAVGGISTDITEHKQAEQKIRQQAALIDIATDAIFVRDLESHILFWSRGAENLYGWTAKESLGKKADELFCRGLSSQIVVAIQATIKKGSWFGELEQTTKTGKKITVASRWTLLPDESGHTKSILVVNTDITEKKQLEQQFYRAQRLESLGTLASGIAHDLNNVFAPITMIAQLLPDRCKNVDRRTQDLFHTLENSSHRGANLVKQILTFARGTEGKPILLQPGHLLQELVKVIRQTFPKSIEIQTHIPTNTLWMVTADPTQLEQVFMNLAVNARDAMPNGGILTISAKNRIIDETYARMYLDAHPGQYTVVTIADTGTGIPPELLERVFEPFFTTKELGKGTGLGLSTVLGIVKNYGGFVQVSSQVGRGTQFQVYLPIGEGIATEEEIKTEVTQGKGELILIVDDELVIQELTKETLENYNYKTLVANDGIEAIALYAEYESDISIVLLDIVMPNMDGLTTIRTLKTMNPEVKIIATSGLPVNRQQALLLGATAFLSKPYTAEDLLTTVSKIL